MAVFHAFRALRPTPEKAADVAALPYDVVNREEAKSIGLVNKVVPAESLLDEAKAMMQTILSKAPLAVRYAKIAINEGIQMDLYRGLELEKDVCALTFGSDDSKEGMSAFLEKRPAVFQNK